MLSPKSIFCAPCRLSRPRRWAFPNQTLRTTTPYTGKSPSRQKSSATSNMSTRSTMPPTRTSSSTQWNPATLSTSPSNIAPHTHTRSFDNCRWIYHVLIHLWPPGRLSRRQKGASIALRKYCNGVLISAIRLPLGGLKALGIDGHASCHPRSMVSTTR